MTEKGFFNKYGKNCCQDCQCVDSQDWTIPQNQCNPINASCYGNSVHCDLFEASTHIKGGVNYIPKT